MARQRTATAVTGFYHQAIQFGQGCRLPDTADSLPSEQVVEEEAPFAFCPPVSVLREDEPVGPVVTHAGGVAPGQHLAGTPVAMIVLVADITKKNI